MGRRLRGYVYSKQDLPNIDVNMFQLTICIRSIGRCRTKLANGSSDLTLWKAPKRYKRRALSGSALRWRMLLALNGQHTADRGRSDDPLHCYPYSWYDPKSTRPPDFVVWLGFRRPCAEAARCLACSAGYLALSSDPAERLKGGCAYMMRPISRCLLWCLNLAAWLYIVSSRV